jgi:glycosyltransferase involved in cell wall biosynthesis
MFRILVLRCQGVRIFYTHYSYPGAIATGLVTRIFGGVSYYWNCGLVWEVHAATRGPRRILQWFTAELPLWLSLKMSHHLVTGTRSLADGYAKNYGLVPESIVVIPNWVDVKRFAIAKSLARKRLSIPPGERVVVFVHHLSPRKGADRLPALARSLRGARLYVIGGGPLERELREAARDLPLTITGKVPNTDIPEYVAAADVFIMPSREEGFPRVLLEAMAAGTPFVATPVGGVPDIVPDPLCLASPEDFPERIRFLLDNPAQQRRLSMLGAKTVRRYAKDPVVRQFEKMVLNPAETR